MGGMARTADGRRHWRQWTEAEARAVDLPRFGRQFYYAAATFVPSLSSNSTGLM